MGPIEDARTKESVETAQRTLEELWLRPEFPAAQASALASVLASRLTTRGADHWTPDESSAQSAQVLANLGIETSTDLEQWKRHRGLDDCRFRDLVASESRRLFAERAVAAEVHDALLTQVLLRPDYPALRARALDKRRQLQSQGLLDAARPTGVDFQSFLTWTSRHLPHLPPSDGVLNRAVVNEYHYVTRCHPPAAFGDGAGRLDDADLVTTPARPPSGTVAQLLGDLDHLGSDHWGQEPLHRTTGRSELADVLPMRDLDRLLTSRHGDVRVLDGGVYLDEAVDRARGESGSIDRQWITEPAATMAEFVRGRSLVLADVHELWAPLGGMAAELAALLGVSLRSQLFVSPPGAMTGWHADPTHLVVVQVHGTKSWLVELDGPEGTPQQRAPLDAPLAPGDVLYIPPHFAHRVVAGDQVSVHVTFICKAPTWSQFAAARAAERLGGVPSLRTAVVGAHWGPRSHQRWVRESAAARKALIEAAALADLSVPGRNGESPPTHLSVEGAFLGACAAAEMTSDTTLRVRPRHQPRLGSATGGFELTFADRTISGPKWITAAVARMLTGKTFRPRDLPLDPGDGVVLARRLLLEGFLEVAPPAGNEVP